MRYELNFDEDKVNDVLLVGGASYDLKGCCKVMNEQQATITELKEENKALKKFIKDNFNEMMDSKMVIDDE